MQTRRDQLQAFKFQNRRALAALLTGQPNIVDPPMRRLTVTTLSGVMIAVLLTVGFTVFGLIRPKAGDSWKEAGSIVVESDSGATYVYLQGKLRPVVNYTSAVLAVGGNQNVHTVTVDRSDIADADRGPQIGITGLPSSLPGAGDLVKKPVSACSRLRSAGDDELEVRVTVRLGIGDGAGPLKSGSGVLVASGGSGDATYLLYAGHRLVVGSGRTATALGLGDKEPLRVGRAFLDTVPPGAPLQPPALPSQRSPVTFGSVSGLVGQLVDAGGQPYVLMPDGVASVNPLQRALLQALPLGPNDAPLDPVITTSGTALGLPRSTVWQNVVREQLTGLPSTVPAIDSRAVSHGGICADFTSGSGESADQPTFGIPATSLPSFQARSVTESSTSQQGRADEVRLPPGRAALARSADGAKTIFLVGDTGKKFAATSPEVLAGFSYSAKDAIAVPAALLGLIPSGRALDPTAARRAVTG